MEARDLYPQWVTNRLPLDFEGVSKVTTLPVFTLRELRKSGVLIPILDQKPYRFDPVHIYDVFFTIKSPKEIQARSLKNKYVDSHGHKPKHKKDLWT